MPMRLALPDAQAVRFPPSDSVGAEGGSRRVDFCIIGVQKSGTTALHAFLSEHPAICMADRKEVHFFDAEEHFAKDAPDYSAYHARFAMPGRHQLLGESTPIYLFWPGALERIAAYNPAMRLIVVFRDPVVRAYSHWRMSSERGREPLDFPAAIREGRERIRPDDAFALRNFTYVERGFYAAQVRRLKDLFLAEQLHFLRTDDLRDRHDATLDAVFRFLGLPARRISPRRVFASGAERRAMSPADIAYLEDLYRDDLRHVPGLTGLDVRDWT